MKFLNLFRRRSQVCFANSVPLQGIAVTGNKAFLPDAAIAYRYNLVLLGSSPNNCILSSANTDFPLGICTDMAEAANLAQPVNVALLGAFTGTQWVEIGGTVAAGDLLQSNGDGSAIKLLTSTGTFYCFGRALMAGVAGDTVEFIPCFPFKVVNS